MNKIDPSSRSTPLSPTRSIDSVVDQRELSPLPDSLRLPPAQTLAANRLAQLFAGAALEDYLANALHHPPPDGDAHSLSRMRHRLRTWLLKIRHAYPEHETTLNSALAVLNEQDRLHELMNLYKNALYAG